MLAIEAWKEERRASPTPIPTPTPTPNQERGAGRSIGTHNEDTPSRCSSRNGSQQPSQQPSQAGTPSQHAGWEPRAMPPPGPGRATGVQAQIRGTLPGVAEEDEEE